MNIEKLEHAKKLFFIALSIDLAVTLINVIATFWQIGIIKDIQSGILAVDHDLLSTFSFWDSFSLLMILTVIGVGIGLIKWLSASYQFAKDALLATGFKQEKWVGAGWIIPFFNLFKPYQVINEIYKAGSPAYQSGDDWKKENASGWLLTWWLFWAVTHFFMWIIGKEMFKKSLKGDLTLNQVIGTYDIQVWSCAISIVVASLWFVVANHLTARLVARAAKNTSSQPANYSNPVTPASQPPAQKTQSISQPSVAAKPPEIATNAFAPTPHIVITESTNKQEQNMENLEDWAYEKVGEELESNNPDKAVWTKAFAQSGGDDKQTKVLYIKLRVEKLIALETSRLEAQRKSEEENTSRKLQEEIEKQNATKLAEKDRIAQLADTYRITEERRIRRIALRNKIATNNTVDEANLIDNNEKNNFLSQCASAPLANLVTQLENEPLLVAVTNMEGNTALHIAIYNKNEPLIRELIDRGANPEIQNAAGITPIGLAKSQSLPAIGELLAVNTAYEEIIQDGRIILRRRKEPF
jgi:hypothetical protein